MGRKPPRHFQKAEDYRAENVQIDASLIGNLAGIIPPCKTRYFGFCRMKFLHELVYVSIPNLSRQVCKLKVHSFMLAFSIRGGEKK
jgi:hypothetical protein